MNRRKYRRIRATIHCRQAGVDFFAPHIEPVDISFGGLRIYSDDEFAVGAHVRLDIFFPGAAPVMFTAEVMWIQAAPRGAPGLFDVGLAFVGLTPDALNALQPLLEPEAEPASASEPNVDLVPAPPDSAVEFDLETDPPMSDPSLVPPATVRKGSEPPSILPLVPVLVAEAEHLRAAQLDPRAAFVLSLIDGVTTVESLLDLSGMPAEETLGIIKDLRQRGIVVLREETGGATES
jgi:PilZ domain-containing protein